MGNLKNNLQKVREELKLTRREICDELKNVTPAGIKYIEDITLDKQLFWRLINLYIEKGIDIKTILTDENKRRKLEQ